MGDGKLHLFGEYELDRARGNLLRAGRPVHLRPQAYKALQYLAEHRGQLVSKEQLVEEVWEGRAVTDDSLVKCLRDVRQALGEGGDLYLRTERGRGYIFELPEGQWSEQTDVVKVVIEEEETDGPEGVRQAVLPSATRGTLGGIARPTPRAGQLFSVIRRHKLAAAAALAALALIAVWVVYFTRFASRGQPVGSVAVLPFANASGDPTLDYLSDGLSESLIDRLSQLPDVKVIARGSSFKYKGREVDPREAARELGVDALVVGRVVRRGEDLQVRAELVDAREGTQVWGEQYSRRSADIQAVQEEMAHAISERLRPQLSGEQVRRLTRRATADSQAYQFYLNGLFHYRRYGIQNTRKALDYFNQAVATDPDFALAWAGVAQAHLMFAGGSWLDPKEANANAKAAAQRALELDETLADAHVQMALIEQHEWDWAGAEREYRRAIELNPSLVEARFWYARYLSTMGRHAEALAEIRRAQELDPLQIRLRRQEAWLLHLARRSDEALRLMQQTFKLEPPTPIAHSNLAFSYEGNGMYEEAVAEHRKANNMFGETTGGLTYLGCALAGAGRRSEAQAIRDRLKATEEYVSPEELAGLYAMLGDKEGALAELEKAYATHDLQLQVLKIDLHLDSLRSDPRFQDLVRRVGLPP